ncbi:MAG: molybdopterin-dependent oxidoreductase [Deltaproteobacteria bacterium]|jgi:sulfoxide reductase catalytic subunit YedY|nr:molybdopterin-dependent oxidoreductase [Deltaproteobacteria bacterium]MBW2479779.1 molybdopterin-dependent oxidoreductase [Deltaproteobacteria bacterium]
MIFRLTGGMVLGLSTLGSLIARAYAQTKRIILPKGTKMTSLIDKNPADLDNRHLEVIPLAEFETMGLTEHVEDIDTWRLKVTGKVQTPQALSYEQVLELPAIERKVLLICPGFFTNHGSWKGISVTQLLKLAQPEPGITHVTFRGPPGRYEKTERFPIGAIRADKVFLAYQVNGQKLPRKHGFPLRLVAEDHYGSQWVKYVHAVEAFRAEG